MTNSNVTVKSIYGQMLSVLLTKPLIVSKSPNVSFHKEVWPNVHNTFVDTNLRDLSWRKAHEIVPREVRIWFTSHLNVQLPSVDIIARGQNWGTGI